MMKVSYPNLVTWSFLAIGFALLFSLNFLRPAIFTLIALGVYAVLPRRKKPPLKEIKLVQWVLPAYFLVCFLSLLHAGANYSWVERGWVLLVFPVLISFYDVAAAQIRRSFQKGVVWGAIALGFANLIIATYRSLSIQDGTVRFDSSAWGGVSFWFSIDHYGNYYFSEFFSFFMHPSYASLAVTLAILMIVLENPSNWPVKVRAVAVIFLTIIIGLLSSRAGIFSLIVSYLILILIFWKKLTVQMKIVLMVVFFGITIALSLNPRVSNLISNARTEFVHNPRIIDWAASWHVVKKHWIVGVGIDRVQEELNEYYEVNNYKEHFANSYNSHNQFLETWIGTGIVGLLLLLLSIAIGFKKALQNRDTFGLLFMLNIVIHFSLESMLNRAMGIFIFVLAYAILFLVEQPHIQSGKETNDWAN